MAKMADKKFFWDGYSQNDFMDQTEYLPEEILAYYLKDNVTRYGANNVFARQLIKLTDSLKPIERRILYAMYKDLKLKPDGKTTKCSEIIGRVMVYHPHGDAPIYDSLVGMTQHWKRAIPLITGEGGFGDETNPSAYSAYRYTEAKISQYAYECFFSDYDPDCIVMVPSADASKEEPLELPSKFPNILINGGLGISYGFSFKVPPFNVNEVMKLTQILLKDREYEGDDLYIYPDIPTGCNLVNDKRNLKEIIETGKGSLIQRSICNIEDKGHEWILWFSNIPWMVSMNKIISRLVALSKQGKISIKEIKDDSQGYQLSDGTTGKEVRYGIVINKAYDPYVIQNFLYKNTQLETSLDCNFNTVTSDLTVGIKSLKDLLLAWIDTRREYKRRLYNKSMVKLESEASALDALIDLTTGTRAEEFVRIIRSTEKDKLSKMISKKYGTDSFQTNKLLNATGFSAISKDSHEKYVSERKKVQEELDKTLSLIHSETRIDAIISSEIDELQKYAKPRKSKIISATKCQLVSNTNHRIIVTKKNLIKKLPEEGGRIKGYGSFMQGDYPIIRQDANNLDILTFFDSFGRYSVMNVSDIPSTEPSSHGKKIFDVMKLEGDIVQCAPYLNEKDIKDIKKITNGDLYAVTLSKNGFMKKVSIDEFQNNLSKNNKIMNIKEDDRLVSCHFILSNRNIMVYTNLGDVLYIPMEIIQTSNIKTMGLKMLDLKDDENCVDLIVIPDNPEYVIVVTEKGCVKKIQFNSFGNIRKRKETTYLSKVSPEDKVIFVGCTSKSDKYLDVFLKSGYRQIPIDTIEESTRRAMCKKVIPVSLGDNIIKLGFSKEPV